MAVNKILAGKDEKREFASGAGSLFMLKL